MTDIWARDYRGAPFRLFDTVHLVTLGTIVILNLAFVFWRGRASDSGRLAFRYAVATLLLVNELVWHLWAGTNGAWSIQTMLPLHLCSVMVYLTAAMLVTRSVRLYEPVYFLGIGGGLQALLTPDAGVYGFPHVRFFNSIVSHGLILTAPIYMTLVEGFRPSWASVRRVLVCTNAYMAVVALVNWRIHSNYLFLAHKPDTPSVLDALAPWPWYILGMEALGLLTMLLLYSPFAIGDLRAARGQSN